MSRRRASSNMHELTFLLEGFSDPGFNIQINQVHRMGELIHQSP